MGRYDYIITGAGASGLSLLIHLVNSGRFSEKKILLLEKSPKIHNDRTWCFWEKTPGLFESIVYKRWDKLWFHGAEGRSTLHDIAPYQYKLIRGIDFYKYCFDIIAAQPNIKVQFGEIEGCYTEEKNAYVIFDGIRIDAEYVFNSVIFDKPKLKPGQFYLLQHFKGWVIKTPAPSFNPGEATLMDFRVGQRKGTTFVYVMPFSDREALVEYTLFSSELLKEEEYDKGLTDYIGSFLGLSGYSVLSKEFGVIPMTNYPFPRFDNHVINIGTAGGATKPSSGYTFSFIQKNSAAIAAELSRTGRPFVKNAFADKRFGLYDGTLLNVLSAKKMSGADIFTRLMENNRMTDVFRFLDNETSIPEEMRIIRRLPKRMFAKAFLENLF